MSENKRASLEWRLFVNFMELAIMTFIAMCISPILDNFNSMCIIITIIEGISKLTVFLIIIIKLVVDHAWIWGIWVIYFIAAVLPLLVDPIVALYLVSYDDKSGDLNENKKVESIIEESLDSTSDQPEPRPEPEPENSQSNENSDLNQNISQSLRITKTTIKTTSYGGTFHMSRDSVPLPGPDINAEAAGPSGTY